MIYKIINENQIQQFPLHIEINGQVYTNALAEEKALETGEWFPLRVQEIPEYNSETQYLLKHYEQHEDHIYQYWTIENNLTDDVVDDDADYVEAAKILLGENEND